MHFAEAIAIVIAGILALGMIDGLVRVTSLGQAAVDIRLIRVDQTAGLNRLGDDRLDRGLLHIGKNPNDDLTIALDQS